MVLNTLRKHKMSQTDYDDMLIEQDHRCAICRRSSLELGYELHIDHDHRSQIIRGLLCRTCNVGIGSFYDNSLLMKRAIKYLSVYENEIEE